MRHRRTTTRIGRSSAHRKSLLASLVCGLISNKRIATTRVKARLARVMAERMVTLAKRKDQASRRLALSALRHEKAVSQLFDEIAPQFEGRQGGYTRIVKFGRRSSDSSEMVLLEFVGIKPRERKKKEKPAPDKK